MVRQWEIRDSVKLRGLIRDFLFSQQEYGSGILASEQNISFYLSLGFEQIKTNNDPHLVCEEDGELIGFVQAGQILNILERTHKTCEILSLYVKPKYEHKFIGTLLFQAMLPYLQRNKYIRTISHVMLANQRMLKNMFINPAIWPIHVTLEGDCRFDEQFVDFENCGELRPTERRVG